MTVRELHLGHVFNYWNKAENHRLQVYMEHNCIHIRMFSFNGLRRFWECADTMTEARKIISSLKKTEHWVDYERAFS